MTVRWVNEKIKKKHMEGTCCFDWELIFYFGETVQIH